VFKAIVSLKMISKLQNFKKVLKHAMIKLIPERE